MAGSSQIPDLKLPATKLPAKKARMLIEVPTAFADGRVPTGTALDG
jgi:hypothetical protein